ncbi:hypothetical protein ACFSTC_25940 [Nonomuraea ferruginea]
MPFGGVKDSGWGRFGLGFAAEEFCETQWVTVRDDPPHLPLLTVAGLKGWWRVVPHSPAPFTL